MNRSHVRLSDVADWHNLSAAFHRAAQGKRQQLEVRQFEQQLEQHLAAMRCELLAGEYQFQPMKSFVIHDPKRRVIHAPCFRERVLHHALMACCGPILNKAMVDDSYACREGKGNLAAVRRAQHHSRRNSWYCGIDFRAYFTTISHARLNQLLAEKFRCKALLGLFAKLIAEGATGVGVGLPIGALTSQYFANYYLTVLDRFLLEQQPIGGMVRYMDDVMWWGESKEQVKAVLAVVHQFNDETLLLEIKPEVKCGPSRCGVLFCGYRVLPERLLLSARRRQRYTAAVRYWEQKWLRREISGLELQRSYAGVHGMVSVAEATAWRASTLKRRRLLIEGRDETV